MLGQEKTRELLEQELERLRNENHRLKEELTSLKEKETNQSFKEKYAVRILESLPDMLTVFNHEGTGIGVVSSEETNHVGVPNSAFAGMHMRDMIPEEAYHNVYNNLQKVIATGKGSTAHHELDVNGAHHYYENRIFPLDEEYVLIMCRDISERVVTQKNLEVFKRVLDKVSDSILAASTDGTLVYANKQFIEEYGVKGELGVQKVYDLPVSLHTKEIFEKRVQEIRDNGGSMGYHAQYTRVGEVKERVHQVSTFIMEDGQEEIVWFFTQDITDVIKNRDELRELNYLLDAILNNIPVYMFVKDPEDDFRYLYWNKALANHSKIPASRALGRTDFEIFPERSDAEKFHQDDLELMRTGERLEMQETYVTAAGETRIVQTLKTHIPLVGRVPLIIGISWDITNVQNIEQELIQARIKAEQSDRLKSAFLANMSHEIRTPLNAIVGFSRLMTTTDNREDEKLYSEIINQNSDVLLQLINDILDLSKIEAGTFEYIKQPMDLGEMCRNVYEIHKGRVQEGVTLTLDNEDDSLMINEDKNRILQLITNLITNAIKFTYEGEIHFGFKLKKDYIDFYVKDTGIGISEEKLSHIFGRFVKLNSFVQGTGLGLAICQMIVEKMGGAITVESELHEGSTFRFTIPYDMYNKQEKFKKNAEREQHLKVAIKSLQLRTLLVAEDVDSNFLLMNTVLGKKYKLIRARDGREAVDMYKENHPDLIFMDIKMPYMDGLEATRLIRGYSKDIPIIALTAFAFESDRERAIEAGCNDYLTKPVSQEAIEKILDKYWLSCNSWGINIC